MSDAVRNKRFRLVVVAVVAVVVAWYAAGWIAGFALSRRWSDVAVERAPSPDGIAVETLELTTQDGCGVRAWLFAPDAPGASVVMLHGWRGSRSTVAHRAEALARRGHAVLAPSLRAHGDSAGSRYDFGRTAWRDVATCIDAFAERRPGRPIVLVGFSYGAAVALEAATRESERVDGLVLDSVFADLRGAVRNRCELFLPAVLEDLATWSLFAAAPIAFPELDAVSPERCCSVIRPGIPVLLLRGASDTRVSAADTERLLSALGPRGTRAAIPDADHDRCFESDPQRWVDVVDTFLRETR